MNAAGAAAAPSPLPPLLRWRALLAALLLVLLFFPIRRYALPGQAFDLEPYRVLAGLLIAGWAIALLVDPGMRLRASGLEAPIVLVVFAAAASLLANPARLEFAQGEVVKKLALFAGFLLTFYVIVSVVRGIDDAEFLCRILVTGGALIALLAVVEARTGFNAFNYVLPLDVERSDEAFRSGLHRAYGPAQHPIALGALLVMLAPLAVHFARATGRLRWWAAGGLLVMGALATVSRTVLLMLAVVLVVSLRLRPRETLRLVPFVLVLALTVYAVQPQAVEALTSSLFPKGGLVAEQAALPGTKSSGRIADLEPSFREFAQRPLLGQGFGTRLSGDERNNALLLDNQWLVTLLETGLAGALGLLWLLSRFLRRAGRTARDDRSPRGSLLAALAAGVAAYGVSMLTYDASSFIQVTYFLFLLLGLGAALLVERPSISRRRRRGLAAPERLSHP